MCQRSASTALRAVGWHWRLRLGRIGVTKWASVVPASHCLCLGVSGSVRAHTSYRRVSREPEDSAPTPSPASPPELHTCPKVARLSSLRAAVGLGRIDHGISSCGLVVPQRLTGTGSEWVLEGLSVCRSLRTERHVVLVRMVLCGSKARTCLVAGPLSSRTLDLLHGDLAARTCTPIQAGRQRGRVRHLGAVTPEGMAESSLELAAGVSHPKRNHSPNVGDVREC